MKVYLDDERNAPYGWIRAETSDAAIFLLKHRNVNEISLDHDLGHPNAGTGYDVLL
ncbi:MAG: cyclic-phosphate processing receiver domain-containing protein [archaeon]